MKCSVCGKEISSKDKYCFDCGARNYDYVAENLDMNSGETINNRYYENKPKNDNSSIPPKYTYEKNMENKNYKFSYGQEQEKEKPVLGILALVFACFGGWLGLVLGIVGLANYKEEKNRKRCKIAIGITIAWFAIGIIIGLLSM